MRGAVTVLLLQLALTSQALDNGLALRPPMGFSTWNTFHRSINASIFFETAEAMLDNGMRDAGYEYINIDGGWWEGSDTGVIVRNSSGYVQVSTEKFPDGLGVVVDDLHSKGFRYGHYTDAGTKACNQDAPMSEGFEAQDVALFASWGIDMIKVDACSTEESPEALMLRWQKLLNATGRPILLSNCRNGCLNDDESSDRQWATWCSNSTNMWRTSYDIKSTWDSMLANLDTLRGRGSFAGPGAWNDPDILEVGVGDFAWDGSLRSLRMNRAHFAMWCITSSPLLAGNDVRQAPENITGILTNRAAIAVNQHYVSNAGDALTQFNSSASSTNTDLLEIWLKPLPNSTIALALLNRNVGGEAGSFSLNFADLDPVILGLASDTDTATASCHVHWIWDDTTWTVTGQVAVDVAAASAELLTLSACSQPQ